MTTALISDAVDLVHCAKARFTDHIHRRPTSPTAHHHASKRQIQMACFSWWSAFARGKPAHSMHAPKQLSILDGQQQERRAAYWRDGAGKKVGSMKNDAIPSQAHHKVNRLMQPADEDMRIQSGLTAEMRTPGSSQSANWMTHTGSSSSVNVSNSSEPVISPCISTTLSGGRFECMDLQHRGCQMSDEWHLLMT